MPLLSLLSAVEQVAAHLRGELGQGRWSGTIPGVNRLAVELGVNRKTVEAALEQLDSVALTIRGFAGNSPHKTAH